MTSPYYIPNFKLEPLVLPFWLKANCKHNNKWGALILACWFGFFEKFLSLQIQPKLKSSIISFLSHPCLCFAGSIHFPSDFLYCTACVIFFPFPYQ